MKAGSETKLAKRGSRKGNPAAEVGQPERELAYEKPLSKPQGALKAGFVRMSVRRAFHLKATSGVEYFGKEGDIVDVPEDIAQELEHKFNSFYDHRGLINAENAHRDSIVRATRI